MRLRTQLLLVSLVTLALPWAGLQILQKLEETLRDGQLQTMEATSKAVAVAVEADAAQFASNLGTNLSADSEPLILHPVQGPMMVDGYFDDWRASEWQAQALQGLPGVAEPIQNSLYAAATQDTVYFYLEVADSERQFYIPANALSEADHVSLLLPAVGTINLYTAAPGLLIATILGPSGVLAPAHAVKGVWHDGVNAYQMEWQLPRSWLKDGFGIRVYDGSSGRAVLANGLEPTPVVAQVDALNRLLAKFTEPGSRIYLVDAKAYVYADVGSLYSDTGDPYPGISHKLVKWLIGQAPEVDWQDADTSGRLLVPTELTKDLSEHTSLNREGAVIYRAFAPTQINGWQGYVVVEKNSNTVDVLVTGVSGTVLFYSLLASVFAGLLCLAFASLMSFRIRRLSRRVETALDAQGNVQVLLERRVMNDEIGDLAKSFAQLLNRLKEYTDYLQSLSSKLSHELRTPLAVVKSSIENLQHLPLESGAKQYAERAQSGAERLSFMLNAMSAANRLEQSLQSADFEDIDLSDMLHELVQAYAGAYPQNTFQLNVQPNEHWRMTIAPDLIAQMLDKLVENAVDFAIAGTAIHLSLTQQKQFVVLKVSNAGPLLPQAMQTQVFDSLVSLREAHHGEGHLGLGLYIVRLIARFHQGQVKAYNDESEGRVIFEVQLPY